MKKINILKSSLIILLMFAISNFFHVQNNLVFAAGNPNNIIIDGSTTVGPIAKAFAEYYMNMNPEVKITVSESGSGNGVKSLINSSCDLANLSRFMKVTEFKAALEKEVLPVAHVLAFDGIAVVVHPSNPINNLGLSQIKDIYMGKINNWKSLGGANMPIIVISRDTNSGTYETFENLIMHQEKMDSKVEYVNSNGAARARIQTTNAAIGFVGIGFIDKSIKAISVESVAPNPNTVRSGRYPIARPLYMFTNGYPKMGSHIYQFVNLYLSERGQEIISEIGFIPVTSY